MRHSESSALHEVGRWTAVLSVRADPWSSPDEHPFTPLERLPQPVITPQTYPSLLYRPAASHPSVNVNKRIYKFYVGEIVPGICPGGSKRSQRLQQSGGNEPADDGNYGSAATRDIEVLQALSRRIHFGTPIRGAYEEPCVDA